MESQQQQGLATVLATEFCLMTQDSVPRVQAQDQCDDRMNTCGLLIDSADKYGTFLNCSTTGDET
jgi:hypothetical protein